MLDITKYPNHGIEIVAQIEFGEPLSPLVETCCFRTYTPESIAEWLKEETEYVSKLNSRLVTIEIIDVVYEDLTDCYEDNMATIVVGTKEAKFRFWLNEETTDEEKYTEAAKRYGDSVTIIEVLTSQEKLALLDGEF